MKDVCAQRIIINCISQSALSVLKISPGTNMTYLAIILCKSLLLLWSAMCFRNVITSPRESACYLNTHRKSWNFMKQNCFVENKMQEALFVTQTSWLDL